MRASYLRSLVRTSSIHISRRYQFTAQMSTVDVSTLKVALCQIGAGSDKDANITHAAAAIEKTADAQLLVLINKLICSGLVLSIH